MGFLGRPQALGSDLGRVQRARIKGHLQRNYRISYRKKVPMCVIQMRKSTQDSEG
jgi:hypothetical protein